MFTGIVEEMLEVAAFERNEVGRRLTLQGHSVAAGLSVGDSLAVNGCCLTVAALEGSALGFDLLEETVDCTSFAGLQPGDRVNVEGALLVGGKLGGHFVSGHVDEAGRVVVFEQRGDNHYLQVQAASEFAKYLALKGSVTIDGVSLTVCEVNGGIFSVWLIPHTLKVTTLGDVVVGDLVNLEFDLLAKYVEGILLNQTTE
jgi:riboflavin synthase